MTHVVRSHAAGDTVVNHRNAMHGRGMQAPSMRALNCAVPPAPVPIGGRGSHCGVRGVGAAEPNCAAPGRGASLCVSATPAWPSTERKQNCRVESTACGAVDRCVIGLAAESCWAHCYNCTLVLACRHPSPWTENRVQKSHTFIPSPCASATAHRRSS